MAAVEKATGNFVERGQQIAAENPEIQCDMIDAVPMTQLTNANKQLTLPSSPSAKTRYHCDVCPNSFADMNTLQFHVKKMHEVRSETRKSLTSTVKAEQDVICHNCLRTPAGIIFIIHNFFENP